MTGELLAGRYRLDQELGHGGMATVFLATDLRLARRVAVKLMHPGTDGSRAERFRREAEMVASLKHPNVLEIHDFGEDGARGPFLVCEWVQGENMRELARELSPVPPEAAAVLGWELAQALGEAHSRGIVHRDVKPENVLVARGGPLKLADFGIAALADQERLTSTGAITGSLAYMAPERIDTGAFSPASDVYAVGVILFELCAGATPHGGKGSAHLAASVMTKDAPPLAEIMPGTPEPLSALVARCLARDSRDRPANGEELAPLLEEVVGRIAGPPAEESRAFFKAPKAYAARWNEARFHRLLSEGQSLLAKGEGARAARILNEALRLRPGALEVMSLLRERPKARRSKALVMAALLAGVISAVGGVGWGVQEEGPRGGQDTQPEPGVMTGAVAGRSEGPPVGAASSEPDPGTPPPPPLEAANPAREAAPGPPEAPARPQESASPPREPGRAASHTEPRTVGAGGTRSTASERRSAQRTSTAVRAESTPPAPSDDPGSLPDAATHLAAATDSAPATEAVRLATLKVTTRPWAEVFVDGQSQGYTPRVRELSLSPGVHRLRFVNPLCQAREEVIEVAAGEVVEREVTLQVLKAEVAISAPPGARIFIDGVEAGVAPLPGPVNVTHGRHLIAARVPGAAPLQREVDVVAGKRIKVVLEVSP
ncbi:MAG TPA: protein kinase [Hyalangium sp.]|nr:protein kinase [Hyalangium sp.]